MDNATERSDWRCLETPLEIEEFMNLFGGFHDACLREIHVATGQYVQEDLSMRFDGRTTVHMLIQRQFHNPSALELRFEDVVGMYLDPPAPNCDEIIFDAAFFFREGVYYWARDASWTPESGADRTTWVAARKVYWRDASDWLGPRIRYRSGVE